MSADELAELLKVSRRTIRRWEIGESRPQWGAMRMLELELARPGARPDGLFRFIDLFAGVGGFRRGFESVGGTCVFTSEWDRFAVKTYQANFGLAEGLVGDIQLHAEDETPDHEILLGGFPCQPFSLAGVSKKNSLGRKHGFLDEAQGTLFFNIVRILKAKRPKAFLLENVKNLRSHDGGRTYAVIMGSLHELGYRLHERVIDACAWVPQHRERVFIAGFRDEVDFSFDRLERPKSPPTLSAVLHSSDEAPEPPYTILLRGRTVVNPKYTLSDHLWKYLQAYAAKHRALGNGFGYSVFQSHERARTLSARYHKDGSEILIAQRGQNPRRLTPRECARLMGFDAPDSVPVRIPVSDTQAYRQFGNAVVVPVVEAISREMVRALYPESTARLIDPVVRR